MPPMRKHQMESEGAIMGTGFQWSPPIDKTNYVKGPLKSIMARKFWRGADGSVPEDAIIIQSSTFAASFIEGLAEAGIEGADKLLEDLKRLEILQIWIGE